MVLWSKAVGICILGLNHSVYIKPPVCNEWVASLVVLIGGEFGEDFLSLASSTHSFCFAQIKHFPADLNKDQVANKPLS